VFGFMTPGAKTAGGTHVWSLSRYGRRDRNIKFCYRQESNPDGLFVWSVSWPVQRPHYVNLQKS